MDPYLEARSLWRGLHTHLIARITEDLQPQLLPRYVAMVEDRVLLGKGTEGLWPDGRIRAPEGRPPAAAVAERPLEAPPVREIIDAPELRLPQRYVAVRSLPDHELVTAIEVLSPWNKTGRGRQEYRAKQWEYLRSPANLVEIDLLRGGRHTIAADERRVGPSDYRVCIHRADTTQFEVLRWSVRSPLPSVPVPLQEEDPDVLLHLAEVFGAVYRAGAYAYIARYLEEPPPPSMSAEDAGWVRERVACWLGAGGAGSPAAGG